MAGEIERRSLRLPGRGVELALLDWGGGGPLVLMHHANGFCAGTLGLVAEGLVPDYRVIGIDARGHGDSSKPEGPEAYRWDRFAEDLVAVAELLASERADGRVGVGLGHSFGGTAVLGAAARRPALFGRLVLVDPVIPPPPELLQAFDPDRFERLRGMVDAARRRRSVWSSRAEARTHFAARSLFAGWLPRALDLYVEHGLRERTDGQVELKCPGEIEATIFSESGGLDVSDLARRVRAPSTWLWAARGNFPRPLYERIASEMADARIVDADCGHLIPMERPELVIQAVREGEGGEWRSSTT
ncbi:MAG TPA: alpha/beta hydrolase [Myxococcota bacterium]|nr:alpha/beta hydrolase [Myxococcota bacterium]